MLEKFRFPIIEPKNNILIKKKRNYEYSVSEKNTIDCIRRKNKKKYKRINLKLNCLNFIVLNCNRIFQLSKYLRL